MKIIVAFIFDQAVLVWKRMLLVIAGFALLCTVGNVVEARETKRDSNLQIKVTNEPIFPHRLKNYGVTEGSARLIVAVNADSALDDWIVIEATHRSFGRAVDRVVEDWKFVAPLEDGIPTGVVQYIDIEFSVNGFMVINTDMNNAVGFMYNLPAISEEDAIRVFAARELNTIPEPIFVKKPVIPNEFIGSGPQEAIFEFFIDRKGVVHVPLLRDGDISVDDRALRITQDALRSWRFAPVTVNGQPVIVKAAQPIKFAKSEKVAEVKN